ncbi:MAG: NAD(P)H-hydrate dehydratase [Candidatus Omnitrophica bacterium]|nr:NAD(P)H-hydrate dehydratase [Candidatus Omnitrophota bacterium]
MRDSKIESQIRRLWHPRPKRADKKDFGRVFILAGSRGYTGAAALTSFAALRAGAGLVTLGCPEKIYSILARRHPEVMVRPFPSTPEGSFSEKGFPEIMKFLKTQDILAFGPGLGRNAATGRLVRRLTSKFPLPVVIDADGINLFKGKTEEFKKRRGETILTPHPGEFVRVFGGKKPRTGRERKERACQTAREFGVFLVLKGHRTVVASPSGKTAVNPTGNPGMATGGTGDVLTGVIAALLGQGMRPFEAARFGVYLHGLAGDLAAREKGEVSLVAGDLVEFLPQALRLVLK